MSRSQLTKKALSESLKELMKYSSLNKITVQQIVNHCGVTRHTFYNHFQDIYDLLGWTYKYEIIEGLDNYKSMEKWEDALTLVLDYIQHNKVVCLNTFHSLGREHLDVFLYKTTYKMIIGIIEQIAEPMEVDRQIQEEIAYKAR